MGGFRVVCAPRAWGAICAVGMSGLLGTGCSTPSRMDLSDNPMLYRPTGFRSAVPADRSVFLAPLRDERRAQPAEASGPYPVLPMPDQVWERPVVEMVDAVLREELAKSGVFAGVVARAEPEACVLQVGLVRFAGGVEEHIAGRRSVARVALEVRVHGPQDAAGGRLLLLEKTCADQRGSEVGIKVVSAPLLLGMSLQATVMQLLAGLDQSNVARSGMPFEVPKRPAAGR